MLAESCTMSVLGPQRKGLCASQDAPADSGAPMLGGTGTELHQKAVSSYSSSCRTHAFRLMQVCSLIKRHHL